MREGAQRIDRREVLYSATGALLVPPAAGAENSISIHAGKLHGRDAFTLTNGLLSLSVLPGGGFIADVHLVSRDPAINLSPLRVPEYQTMDPYRFDLKLDGAKYGTGIQRQLMSGYMGHFTCFPQFGMGHGQRVRNPWVLDWQINGHANDFPVPGKVVARGLCWGDSPAAGGVKQAVSEGKSMNVPTFGWIGPREKRSQSYVIFIADVPRGWRGTADISLKDGGVQIFEKGTSNVVSLSAKGLG